MCTHHLSDSYNFANVAQSVERRHGKAEVSGSIPDIGSARKNTPRRSVFSCSNQSPRRRRLCTIPTMTDDEFAKLVDQGIDTLPERFQKLMQNVAVVIADDPPTELQDADGGGVVFGFYEGVPVPERGSEYSELPDKITIFKNSILSRYSNPEDIRECVENTVWHEVAHHFGFDEAWVAREEIRRGKTK